MIKMESGSIFEIPLQFNYGFGYGKYINISHIIGRQFDANLFRVFDFVSQKPIGNIRDIIKYDLLLGPLILIGTPPVRGQHKWKFIGSNLKESDLNIPDYKYTLHFPYIVEDESSIGPWSYTRNITEVSKPISYEKVKHLEQPTLHAPDQIASRIVMEMMRKSNIDPMIFFKDEEEYIKRVYLKMINVPIYSTIPKEIRGKAITS